MRRPHFRGDAGYVAVVSLWELLAWGINTVILEQENMELVTAS